jgi:hypothetical protein
VRAEEASWTADGSSTRENRGKEGIKEKGTSYEKPLSRVERCDIDDGRCWRLKAAEGRIIVEG